MPPHPSPSKGSSDVPPNPHGGASGPGSDAQSDVREGLDRTAESALPTAGPRVFGVLGGIASGKSTVADALAGPGGIILSADAEAHAALELPEIQERLLERFGPSAISADGTTDRAALGQIVFGDMAARKDLESWIHPVVRARLWEAFRAAVETGTSTIVVDVPLLLESAALSPHPGDAATAPSLRAPGSAKELEALPVEPPPTGLLRYCDYLIFVDAPLQDRDGRAVARRGWQPGEVARREKAQMPLDEKRRQADLIIHNDQGPEELRARVHEALARLDQSPRSPASKRSN